MTRPRRRGKSSIAKKRFLTIAVVALASVALFQTPTQAQEGSRAGSEIEEARRLNQRALELTKQGQYDAAIPFAKRALRIWAKTRGPSDPEGTTSLRNLAALCEANGDHSRAALLLSACETGMGDVRTGDGVYGLRRALVLAGAETQIMTLWRIDDEVTQSLMAEYYEKIGKGMGRSDAMRDVTLKMLSNPKTANPKYWASFIVSGDPSPLHNTTANGATK